MKKILSKIKTILIKAKTFIVSLGERIKKNVTSKEWWKQQYKVRDKKIFLYGFWVVYGGWLFMKPFTFAYFDLPATAMDVVGAGMIAFIWFFFYIVNMVSDMSMRKMHWKLIDLYREHNEFLIESNDKLIAISQEAIAETKALKDKYEPES